MRVIPRFSCLPTLSQIGSMMLLLLLAGWVNTAQAQTAQFSYAKSTVASGFNTLGSVAVDASGNIYAADQGTETVYKEIPNGNGGYDQSIVASGFSNLMALAADVDGNVYVADQGANKVYKETPNGGSYTQSTVASGFGFLIAVAADANNNVYIADAGANSVYKEIPNGSSGYTQSTVASGFSAIYSIAVDTSGNVYAADHGTNVVYKETLSGGAYSQSSVASGFSYLLAVAADPSGNVYVADEGANTVYEVVLSGGAYSQTTVASGFTSLVGVAVDTSGNVYAADQGGGRPGSVYKLQTAGVNFGTAPVATTTPTTLPLTFTINTAGTLNSTTPYKVLTQGATQDAQGNVLDFTAASSGNTCTGSVSTTCTVNVTFTPKWPGLRYGAVILTDSSGAAIAKSYVYGMGTGPQAVFPAGALSRLVSGQNEPAGIAVDAKGDVFFTNYGNGVVQELPVGSSIPTIITTIPQAAGVAVDGAGNVFVGSGSSGTIYEIVAVNGTVSSSSVVNNLGLSVSLPADIKMDGSGNLFVAEQNGHIVSEFLAPNYTTKLTLGGGYVFSAPEGLALDSNGNIFVADQTAGTVTEIMAPAYTTVNPIASGLSSPNGVTVDAAGNIYVAGGTGSADSYVKEYAQSGALTSTLATSFNAPQTLTVDGSGKIYVTDLGNNNVDIIDPTTPPSLNFDPVNVGSVSSNQTVMLANIGNKDLIFPPPTSGQNPSIANGFTLGTGTCPVLNSSSSQAILSAGLSCTVAVNFRPIEAGSNSGSVTFTDNALNVETSGVGTATQSIGLNGTAIGITISPTSLPDATYGVAYSQTFTASGGTAPYTFAGTAPAGLSFSIAGVLSGTPNSAGNFPFTVTATDANGISGTATFTLTVNQATTTLTWPTPAAIPYGTPISSAEFNAMTTPILGGTFTYSVGIGTILSVGTHALSVTFTPSNPNYTSASATVQLTVNAVVPGAPTIGTATAAPGQASVTFSAPAFTGGTPITQYTVTSSTGGFTASGGSSPITVTGLTPGTAYTFTVTASNSAGPGSRSAASNSVTIPVPNLVVTTANDDAGTASNCTTQTSTTTGTDTSCSLRDALLQAAVFGGGNITFDSTKFASATTITLSNGTLVVPTNTAVQGATSGSGATLTNLVKVAGGGPSSGFSVFTVNSGATGTSIANLTITNGYSSASGGGISNNGMLKVTNSTVTNNSTGNLSYGGGGISNNGTLTVISSTVSGNSANNSSGAGINNTGTMTITNSTIFGNTTNNGYGGGIYNVGALTVTNSTLSGNVSANGGPGGGIYNAGGSLSLASTIVAGNSATSYADIESGSFTSSGGNLVGLDPAGTSQLAVNLAPLSNYGGPTQTMPPLPGSLALSASVYQSGEPATDQRGYARPASGTIDIGAVQVTGNGPTVTSLNPAIGTTTGENSVTITGSGFTGATAVYFGTTAGTNLVVVSDTSIKVDAPAGTAGTVDVVVVNAGGISGVSSADHYTYQVFSATAAFASKQLTQNHDAGALSTVTVSGGTSPLTYSISPSLPAGLHFDAATGNITQAPTATSSSTSYTVTVTDNNGLTATASFALSVNNAVTATQAIPTKTLTYNVDAGSFTPVTGGGGTGTRTYTISPALPSTLSLNASTGAITGTPGAASSAATYTVTVTDVNGATALNTFLLTVNKATATVTLGGLTATYDGNAHAATATTSPSGLTVDFTYDGSAAAPTNAKSYTVIGTINDANYQGTATGTLTISKAMATVTLSGLTATYDGNAHAATATTTPTGLTVDFTYDGSAAAPTNAKSYTVIGTINDANYRGTATGILTIGKATASVTLGGLTATYDGNAHAATATTTPTGLTVDFTYDGSAAAPTNAKSYTVIGTIDDANYQGTATGTLTIGKATATVTLGNLAATYNGSAHAAIATTTPSGLTVNLTYNGSSTAPTNAGSYPVNAAINDANYQGTATGTLEIDKATATVTLANLSATYNGGSHAATATTSPAGLTVDFTYNGSATVPSNAGNYAIVATVNDANYQGTATGTLVISKATATVTLGNLAAIYNASTHAATATTTPAGLTVDLTYNGSATVPSNAGSYAIVATVNDANYQGTATGTLVISKATATVTLGNLAAIYNASTHAATATTTPAGLTVDLTYDGSVTAPTNAKSYTVVGTINDANYQGTATGTLVIDKATAVVILGSLTATYDSNAHAATATTTPAGLTVNLTYNSSAAAPTHAGNYPTVGTVQDANYTGTSTGTLVIGKATPMVVTWPTTSVIASGSTLSTSTFSGGVARFNNVDVPGTFTWTNPATVPTAGTNSYPVLFTPTDAADYNTVAGTVQVSTNHVATTTALQSSAAQLMLQSPVTFTATVATSSGTPTGSVSFLDGSTPLGSVPLVNGVASLTTSTLAAGVHTILAMYGGDTTYAGSNSTTVGAMVIDLTATSTVGGGSSSGNNASATVLPGSTVNAVLDFTTTLNVTQLPVPVALTLTGLPDGATVGVNPNAWSQMSGTSWTLPAGATLVNSNVAIRLPSIQATNSSHSNAESGWQRTASAPVLLSLLLLPFSVRMRSVGKSLRGGVMLVLLLMAGLAATVGLTGCGTNNGFLGQQQKTYNVTMTVTAGTVTRTNSLTITVQ